MSKSQKPIKFRARTDYVNVPLPDYRIARSAVLWRSNVRVSRETIR